MNVCRSETETNIIFEEPHPAIGYDASLQTRYKENHCTNIVLLYRKEAFMGFIK